MQAVYFRQVQISSSSYFPEIQSICVFGNDIAIATASHDAPTRGDDDRLVWRGHPRDAYDVRDNNKETRHPYELRNSHNHDINSNINGPINTIV